MKHTNFLSCDIIWLFSQDGNLLLDFSFRKFDQMSHSVTYFLYSSTNCIINEVWYFMLCHFRLTVIFDEMVFNELSYTNIQGIQVIRALDKREYSKIIFLISHRNHNYVVCPHQNRLVETVLMKVTTDVFMQENPSSELSRRDGSDEAHNICFYAELTKIISNYHQILPFI